MRKISESKAFDLSIAVIRTAQGKGNPADFVTGTPEWQSAQLGMMQDTMRITGLIRSESRSAGRANVDGGDSGNDDGLHL